MILFKLKTKTKIYWNFIQYHTYKIFKMEEYFLKKEEQIQKLTKDLDDRKYARLCFIEFIDEGSSFHVDNTGIKLTINRGVEPTSYKEKAAYLVKVASLYDRINEALDKINIQFEPHSVSVTHETSSTLNVKVNIVKPPEQNNNGYIRSSYGSYSTF